MAVAKTLTSAGAEVTVLERSSAPGGRAGADEVQVGGERWRFDLGAEFIASFYTATLRMVGADRRGFVRLPIDSEVVIDGRYSPLPATLPAVLRTPLLSSASKGRLLALGVRVVAWRRPRWAGLAAAADLDDRSATDFFAETVGRDYVERVLPATLDSLSLSPAADTSRVVALAQMREALGVRLLCPPGGLEVVWSALAQELHVRCGVEVVRMGLSGDSVDVDTAGGETLQADAAVLAVPPATAAPLLPVGHPDRLLAEAARFSPVVKVHLALATPSAILRPVCPAGLGRHALAGVVPVERKGTGQVPAGRGGLEICAAPWLAAQLLQRSDGDVHDRLVDEAQRLLRMPIEGVLGMSVVRIPEGVPLFYVGWLRRLCNRSAVGHQYPVVAAGDWLASPSLEGAVRSGVAAAAVVLERTA